MIRCVRLFTGPEGNTLFEEGEVTLAEGAPGDFIGEFSKVAAIAFRETKANGPSEWHQDPEPRYVITLSGVLEFETRPGATFTIRPGDILLAEDNSGTGHRWRLLNDEPWRRVYVDYLPGVSPKFTARSATDQDETPA